MTVALVVLVIQHQAMLTRLYVEALLTESKLADQVWKLWDANLILDELAAMAWWLIAVCG